MAEDIYHQLRDRLDQYALGFRTTGTDVELQILRKLFTEEEAEIYLHLSEDLQTAEAIAEEAGRDLDYIRKLLQSMTEKGLTFPKNLKDKGAPTYYAAAPWAHGIIENQLKRMDREMAELFEKYLFAIWTSRGPTALRNIPVETSIEASKIVAPYDDIKEIIRQKDRIVLADCVCREWQDQLGNHFDEPKEVCMLFGFYAEYYAETGLGRWITQEEALTKLEECQKVGLVPQLSNSESPEALCNCHKDCCGQMRLMKMIPAAGLMATSNYFAQLNNDLCTLCEECIERCPMDAISLGAEDVEMNRDRCIGCGLCVTVCADEALTLEQRPEESRILPPKESNFMRSSELIENSIK